MSYKNAKACFDQNILANAETTNKETAHCWNLNRGLFDLTLAIEKDFETLNERIKALETRLEQKVHAAAK